MRRVEILFVDLDNTLWKGVLGEDETVAANSDWLAVFERLLQHGIIPCILTNNMNRSLVQSQLMRYGIALDSLGGIICCPGPKVLYAARILERLSLNWDQIAIVDDDEVVRADFQKKSLASVCGP